MSIRPAPLALLMVLPLGARTASPLMKDLACLIEGKGRAVADYHTQAGILQDPALRKRLGIRKLENGNPFMEEYRLPSPIEVFGHRTDRIALAGSGILAILPGVDPDRMARELHLPESYRSGTKVMFARVITDRLEDEGGLRTQVKITLNLSTVTTHPGCVLVGTDYRLELLD
nr:hypothetical protein [uncultured Holophaga sp.]